MVLKLCHVVCNFLVCNENFLEGTRSFQLIHTLNFNVFHLVSYIIHVTGLVKTQYVTRMHKWCNSRFYLKSSFCHIHVKRFYELYNHHLQRRIDVLYKGVINLYLQAARSTTSAVTKPVTKDPNWNFRVWAILDRAGIVKLLNIDSPFKFSLLGIKEVALIINGKIRPYSLHEGVTFS